jgi:hypothetical protein
MSLATYEDARPWAKAIKEEILEKRMPPWRPVKGYGEFRNAPSLTQREVDLIVNWVEGGAPRGDEKELPEGPLFGNQWSLGKPDLVLGPTPTVDVAPDADRYQTFVLSAGANENKWVQAIDIRPGNRSVVHCATVFLERDQMDSQTAAAPMSDRRPEATVLATWAPGQKPIRLDDGFAQLVQAGSRIKIRIHYHGSGEAAKDATEIGLYLAASAPRKRVSELVVAKPDAAIAAGAELQRVSTTVTTIENSQVIAIRPAVNPLLVSLQATAFKPDGSQEVLIWTRGYQFDWPMTYYARRPVELPSGTRVEVVAYFDNSGDNPKNPNDPPRQVQWSEISSDPLCVLLVAK